MNYASNSGEPQTRGSHYSSCLIWQATCCERPGLEARRVVDARTKPVFCASLKHMMLPEDNKLDNSFSPRVAEIEPRQTSNRESAVILNGGQLTLFRLGTWRGQRHPPNRLACAVRMLTELQKKICVEMIVSSASGNADQASYSRPVTAFRTRSVGPRWPEAAEKTILVNDTLQRGLLTTPCTDSELVLPNLLSTFVTSPHRSQSFARSVHDIFAPVRRPCTASHVCGRQN